MYGLVAAVFLVVCAAAFTLADPASSQDKFQKVMSEFVRMLETNATWRAEFEQQVAEGKAAVSNTFNFTFNCQVNTTSATPKSVHELRPQEINVIAALGDSITAGNGIDAWWPWDVLKQQWGESWCIGGNGSLEEDVHTIANLMRKFNGNITGYSTGSGYFIWTSKTAALNVAIPGSTAEDIPKQADRLIDKMKNDSRIDFENDWKLITLLIGGNDLCDYCTDEERFSPRMFKQHIKETLDKLHTAVPRALVNLVAMADISPIPEIRTRGYCPLMHIGLCNCARKDKPRPDLKEIQVGYHNALSDLAWAYNGEDNFTVVLQPFLLEQEFPRDPDDNDKYDRSYIAPDCFHPNKKAHQGLNFFYWNTMLTPVGQKPLYHDWNPSMSTTYKCPTEDSPFIFTNHNSGNITKPDTPSPTRPTLPTTTKTTKTTPSSTKTTPSSAKTTTDVSGSSASSQFAFSLYNMVSLRVFLYGSLVAVLLY